MGIYAVEYRSSSSDLPEPAGERMLDVANDANSAQCVGAAWHTTGMETYWGLTQTAWIGLYTVATFGLLAVAIAAACVGWRHLHEARKHTEAMRAADLEARRPYVIVSIELSRASPQLFDLVIKNIGNRPALDTTINLEPPPVRAREVSRQTIAEMKLLTEPISQLAPGQELRVFYDSYIDRKGRTDLPTSHQVSLTYHDSAGRWYPESGVIDIESMKGAMYTEVKTIHNIGQTLEKIQNRISAASLLHQTGSLTVAAAVESRREQQARLSDERAEQQREYEELNQHIERSPSRHKNATKGQPPSRREKPANKRDDEL